MYYTNQQSTTVKVNIPVMYNTAPEEEKYK
jgi:hypothetical protein